MTIDKAALRAKAEAATAGEWLAGPGSLIIDAAERSPICELGCRAGSVDYHNLLFIAAANPATILALLEEIEALQGLYRMHQQTEAREMRILKAENEALRKDAARLTWLDESKEVDSVGPTLCCGKHRATLREAIDAAMAMEVRHG